MSSARAAPTGRLLPALILIFGIVGLPARASAATLVLTSPNGGEVWTGGSTQTITWQEVGVEPAGVTIELLRNGAVFDEIGTAPASTENLPWTVCAQIGDGADYSVRITCPSCNPPLVDESGAPFTISGAPRPTLTITSPIGGEVLTAHSAQQVSWTSTDAWGFVQVWLVKAGTPWALLGFVPMADGAFTWPIDPRVDDAADYTIRLQWANPCGPPLSSESPAPFAIAGSLPAPTLTLTSPNGGETFAADTTIPITWSSTDPSGEVSVWLRADIASNGTYCDYLGSALMESGRLDWAIPATIGDRNSYQIELRARNGHTVVGDMSDAPFAITGHFMPQLVVTAPSAGAVWPAGSAQEVTWTITSSNGLVDISVISQNLAVLYAGRAQVSAGRFPITLCPSMSSGSIYAIEIRSVETGRATRSANFRVDGPSTPTLSITSPATGAVWAAGSTQMITWTSAHLTGMVDIYVPDDLDHHFGLIQVPVEEGAVAWHIPPTLSPGSAYTLRLISWNCGNILVKRSVSFSVVAPTSPWGDYDSDGDVDLRDFAHFQTNHTGSDPQLLFVPTNYFDQEPDGDVDVSDYSAIEAELTGPAQ